MEQQANQPQAPAAEQAAAPEMELEVELGDPRQEFEALKGDYEALLMDVRRLFQSIKAANYPKRAMDMGKEQVLRSPLTTILGAFALGMVFSRMTGRRC